MTLALTVTYAGRAAIVAAGQAGTNAVRIASVGLSATAVVATPGSANLPDQFKTVATVSGASVAADTIHMIVRDESADTYTARSFALYLADGTLFALYGQADPLVQKAAASLMLLAIDVKLSDITAAQITFGDANFLNPPATTATAGVVELADDIEAQALVDAVRALTPRGLGLVFTAAKILQKLVTVDGAGSGLDADTLDGDHGSAFAKVGSKTIFNDVIFARGASEGMIYLGADQQHYLYFDGVRYQINGAPLYLNGAPAWYGGNDGAGSGLDADLLDGDHASAFAKVGSKTIFNDVIFARGASEGMIYLGADQQHYLYFDGVRYQINGAPLYLNGAPAWYGGNDGAGSGLDSDLLDGREGSFYADVVSRLGFNPVEQGGGPGQLLNKVRIGWSGARIKVAVDNIDKGQFATDADLASPLLTLHGVAMLRAGNNLWGPDNDGAGSGLDADLLDGHEGSFYADVVSRLGFNPVEQGGGPGQLPNKVRIGWSGARIKIAVDNIDKGQFATDADLASPLLTLHGVAMLRAGNNLWGPDNDGAGSGLDADLLDGYDSAYFRDVVSRLGFNPVEQGGGPGQLLNKIRIGWSGARIKAAVDGIDKGQLVTDADLAGAILTVDGAAVRRAGNNLWGPENDGAGSGLDADLLDGRHAADFAAAGDFSCGSNEHGYWERRPNGVIEQWGTVPGLSDEGNVAISFPVPFSDDASVNVQAIGVNSDDSQYYDMWWQRVSKDRNGCVLKAQFPSAGGQHVINGADWRAIGR